MTRRISPELLELAALLGVNLAASEAVEQAMDEENADYVGLGASANPRRRFTDHEVWEDEEA